MRERKVGNLAGKSDKKGLDGVSRNVGPLLRQMATVLTLASRDVKQ